MNRKLELLWAAFVGYCFITYIVDSFKPAPHKCGFEQCPYKGWDHYGPDNSEYRQGSEPYMLDSIHFAHPEWDTDKIESAYFLPYQTI